MIRAAWGTIPRPETLTRPSPVPRCPVSRGGPYGQKTVRPVKAGVFSGSETHQGKSQLSRLAKINNGAPGIDGVTFEVITGE